MVKLYDLEKFILAKISYIQLCVNSDEINTKFLYEVIRELSNIKNDFQNQYTKFQQLIAKKPRKKAARPIFDSTMGRNNCHEYAELSKEFQDFIVRDILNDKDCLEIDNQFKYSLEIIHNHLDNAALIIMIHKCLFSGSNNILKVEIKGKIFCNLSNLNTYISKLSKQIKFELYKNQAEFLNSQKELFNSTLAELIEIHTRLNKLSCLDQNEGKVKYFCDAIEYLVYIFGKSITQINTNSKFEILINLDGQEHLLISIINQCQRIEARITSTLNQAQAIIQLIDDCVKNEKFVSIYQDVYFSKRKYPITTLVKNTTKHINNLNQTLSFESPTSLNNSMTIIQSVDYRNFKLIYEQTMIALGNNHKVYELDLNRTIALMDILGYSILAIGLDESNNYVFYYNQTQAMTLKTIITRLLRVKNKIEPYISKTEVMLILGKQCLKSSQIFSTVKQSYLINQQHVKSYIEKKYENLLYSNKIDSETNRAEREQKNSMIKSLQEELIKLHEHVQYVNSTVYTINTHNNATLAVKNQNQPVESISFLYKSVYQLILKNDVTGKLALFVVSDDGEKKYLKLHYEGLQLNGFIERLTQKAKQINHMNQKFLQPKVEEIPQQENQTVQHKYSYTKYFTNFLGVMIFVFVLLFDFGNKHTENFSKLQLILEKIPFEIPVSEK